MTNELIARLPLDELGGARVFRPCKLAGKDYARGGEVPLEILRQIPKANLRALLDQRYLVGYPTPRDAAPVAFESEVHVCQSPGTSRYNVIAGKKLNTVPLSKAEAEKLAESVRAPT